MKLFRVEDVATGEVRSLTLDEAEGLTKVGAHEIAWAIEEFGVCETGEYTISEYPAEARAVA